MRGKEDEGTVEGKDVRDNRKGEKGIEEDVGEKEEAGERKSDRKSRREKSEEEKRRTTKYTSEKNERKIK